MSRDRGTRRHGLPVCTEPGCSGPGRRSAVSDRLNISPRARWVVTCVPCQRAAPEDTAGGLYTPGGFEKDHWQP